MFGITHDIRTSPTLPTRFYTDLDLFELSKNLIFRNSWHLVNPNIENRGFLQTPLTVLPGFLDESMLMIHRENEPIEMMSNVCTHRGNILVEQPNNKKLISCGYHGRCFDTRGQFRSMPFFDGLPDFPSEKDHLKNYETLKLGPMLFSTLHGDGQFAQSVDAIQNRMPDFDFGGLHHVPEMSIRHPLKAHWALYVDNYLEGFHVPFVHPFLGSSLDMQAYHYEVFENHNLQLGIAKDEEPIFELNDMSMDFGKNVFAYYWWIFPNIMLNCYPWGVSLNCIEPVNSEFTYVRYETYLFDQKDATKHTLTNIDDTEMEDEKIVLQVQKGIKSSAYTSGRYSPIHERCVHQFHLLLQKMMRDG